MMHLLLLNTVIEVDFLKKYSGLKSCDSVILVEKSIKFYFI